MRGNVIIIGSGIAALQLAKKLSRNLHVIVFTKSTLTVSNSYLAQGGIAVALSDSDNAEKHYHDTMEAGRYHNNSATVAMMTKEAPELIKELINEGCPFDRNENGEIKLGLEGAHSEKRIIHGGGDATGKTVIDFLQTQINHVTVMENMTVYELIISENRCVGVKVKGLDGHTIQAYAEHIVIATGGLGQIYSFTSSAETVTGDGLALAYRAGAELSDMEFVQFHPTLISANGKGVGLASEAVRGEGAKLVTEEGTYLMEGFHPYKDLSPRHVVSQEIYKALKEGHTVYLDISTIDNFVKKFPTVASICIEHGIDLASGRIPVVPGCHFLMGGIRTDLNAQTTIPGLYAIGEAACTGVHGANRLASNSLLEGLYFGNRLADFINENSAQMKKPERWLSEVKAAPPKRALPDIELLKSTMMERTGIARTKENLEKQLDFLKSFAAPQWVKADLEDLSIEELNEVFMLICSWLVTKAALKRTESRGGHLRLDYPNEDAGWEKRQIIQQLKGDRIEQSEITPAAGTILSGRYR
ncbi:L-aspartate oxidase [Bacillus benzoevorans]|uniref:L-aspartate oxidase n=1 Tax=Bacillus benzoevorans TaxID=1456 RepID=A0A7X0HSB6_9BACI|nr:L-aspartate oxidase [Bacillus benzoevorans]MBB6445891.1 L-aspartate oxidase [Bacillus benzoevorans]